MFTNEPFTDFAIESNRTLMEQALTKLQTKVKAGKLIGYPLIEGKPIETNNISTRENPSIKDEIIGRCHFANEEHVEDAFSSLTKGAKSWSRTTFKQRAEILRKVSKIMRERRFELNALIILESGKPWKEADADVAEAIDFCDYYANETSKFASPIPTSDIPGEENFYIYQPRGITIVISPWNFPLAIACGMTVAALVTGNTTILKPSEQTSLIAFELANILLEAGVPSNAFAFLPGVGEVIGKKLVEDKRTAMICFTGSKQVGLEIIKTASTVVEGQHSIKKVVAELGGKNAIIVDDDADIDDAVRGVIRSAFGFSGQKCSACSRLIVLENIYEKFLERLVEATKDLIIGDAKDPATFLGAVVDEEAKERINKTINKAIENSSKESSKCILGDVIDPNLKNTGHYVSPTIFKDVPTNSTLWRDEIFGPVIAATKAKNFDHAIELANDTEYALTGGVFSRDPEHIEIAKREFKVGNLYINRPCTGALVGRQPFGGFKMSGIGSKAGGQDYLLQFMEPRVITEKVKF